MDFTNVEYTPAVGSVTLTWEMPNHLSGTYPVTVSNTVTNN